MQRNRLPVPAFLFFAVFLLGAWASSPEKAEGGSIQSNHPLWLSLLHFPHSSLVSSSSSISSKEFFLHPKGAENPALELEATREAFAKTFSPHTADSHALCRYPARAKALGYAIPHCPRLEKWKEAISPDALEIVFAAAFVNSPSSMYGHSFLKFSRKNRGELLDYTLNFGAETGNSSGLSYILMGLSGGFSGYFATTPFYLKIHEYSNVENRDFWVYPLQLTEAQLELLLLHAWELRGVSFPYYFLKKNCSYYLLEFLQVAWPEENLLKDFSLWAIPMDTIRALKQSHKLGSSQQRVSREKEMLRRYSLLSKAEQKMAFDLVHEAKEPTLTKERAALILDAAYELFRFRNPTGNSLRPEARLVEERILQYRRNFSDPKTTSLQEQAPEEGHKSQKISLLFGKRENNFWQLSYRGALHDFLQNPLGYERGSELAMGDFSARLEQKKIFLQEAHILRIRSLSPTHAWAPKVAWEFTLGMEREDFRNCKAWNCSVGMTQAAAGKSFSLGSGFFYTLLGFRSAFGAPLEKHFQFSLEPKMGFFYSLAQNFRLQLEAKKRLSFWGDRLDPLFYSLALAKNKGEWNFILRASGPKEAYGFAIEKSF